MDGESRLYVYVPNSQSTTYGHPFLINQWGFRGNDFLERHLEGEDTFRVMALGDSITAGIGIAEKDRYTNILEGKLNNTYPATSIEVINLGVQGFGTIQEEKILRRMWDVVQPNLTIVGFCSNDPNISYNYHAPYKISISGTLRPYFERLLLFRILEPIYDKLYRKIYNLPTVVDEIKEAYNLDSHDWKLFEVSVEKIGSFILNKSGASPLVIYLGERGDSKRKYFLTKQEYQNVRYTFEKNGFIWVDMKHFRYSPVSRFENHPNEETHKYFADALFNKITELKIIPQ